MKSHFLFITFISLTTLVSAQSRWGIEFKGDRHTTYNSDEIGGGVTDFGYYFSIENEDNLTSYSQSLGLVYRINDRNLIKLHLGSHQNGSLIDYTYCESVGNCTTYSDAKLVYHYFQVAPSYCYRLIDHRMMIPVEAGININFESQKSKILPGTIKDVNLDYELSIGLDYRLDPELIIGIHGLFTGNITGYQNDYIVIGYFLPKSLGLEFSIMYEFGKSQDVKDE